MSDIDEWEMQNQEDLQQMNQATSISMSEQANSNVFDKDIFCAATIFTETPSNKSKLILMLDLLI